MLLESIKRCSASAVQIPAMHNNLIKASSTICTSSLEGAYDATFKNMSRHNTVNL